MNRNIDYNKFFSDLNISNHLKVEEDLGSGFVKLKISEAERRQALQDINTIEDIVLECLRNCRDAGSKNILIATKKTGDRKRFLYFIDDGSGIPEKFHKLIFQSRVTSKLENSVKDAYGFHGRGMALFSIKLNVDNIKITHSRPGSGTCIFIEADTDKIPEKKDQSLMPSIVKNENDFALEGGTNNIVKLIMDFSLQNPQINVFYGNLTQIVSTMINISLRANGKNSSDSFEEEMRADYKNSKKEIYLNYLSKTPGNANDMLEFEKIIKKSNASIITLPSIAANYAVLGQILSEYFNMNISERGIQRIFYGEISPLRSYNSIFKSYISQNNTEEKLNLKIKKNSMPDKSKTEVSNSLILHDEANLANRFKDDD
ncbi:MAG: ATP-binding protein, partial [Actinobacteria bacterium]|nr:ATP-binding protein [Actinomycetota bacterium]